MAANLTVIPDLAGKAVLITGASTGIGAALARGFAAQGAQRRDQLSFERRRPPRRSRDELREAGGEPLLVRGDVTECRGLRADRPTRPATISGGSTGSSTTPG